MQNLTETNKVAIRMAHFLKDDTGAVPVDWVVLTASLVGVAYALDDVKIEELN